MRIERDIKLDYCDVLFRPKRSTLRSRSEVNLKRSFTFKHSAYTWRGIPIMAANMHGVGTVEMAIALQEHDLFTCLTKDTIEIDSILHSDSFAVSTGTSDNDFERLSAILMKDANIQFICIDVANGYSEHFVEFVERVRIAYPKHTIIAGNVVTAEMTEELILRGADIVKVGIGPGSVCTTRIKTGVGYPQLSAVIECADAAHGIGGHIIADGGCATPGDVAKAFGAGADFVMLGGMLAGCDEGGGEQFTRWKPTGYYSDEADVILKGDRRVQFYGMSSKVAQEKSGNGFKNYRASEGRVVEVPYKGSVGPIVDDILGGVRSACTYVGAASLKELSKRTTFIQVNNGRQYNTTFEQLTTGE
jgi:GMP reductase